MTIATIQTAPGGMTVVRNGQELNLQEGDELFWGDKITNSGTAQAAISIPGSDGQQTSTVLTMEAGAQARLEEIATPFGDGSSRTQVVAMSDGVELYDVDVETEMMGLVGAAGVAGGSGAAAAAGGGLLGLFALDDDDNDVPPEGPAASGIAGASSELGDYLAEATPGDNVEPMEPTNLIFEPLSEASQAAGESVDEQGDGVITDVGSGILGVPDENYDPEAFDGVPGAVDSMGSGIKEGTESNFLQPTGEALDNGLEMVSEGTDDGFLEDPSNTPTSPIGQDSSSSPIPMQPTELNPI